MFGQTARLPVDIALGMTSAETTIPQYVKNLQTSLETMYVYVEAGMARKQSEQKVRYDAKSQGKPFSVGDMVWLHNPAVPRGKSPKLHRPWTGPFRIVTKLSDSVYRLQHVQFRRQRPVFLFNRLKACSPNTRFSGPKAPVQGETQTPPPVGGGLELLDDDPPSTPAAAMDDELRPNRPANHVEDAVASPTGALLRPPLPVAPPLLTLHRILLLQLRLL